MHQRLLVWFNAQLKKAKEDVLLHTRKDTNPLPTD